MDDNVIMINRESGAIVPARQTSLIVVQHHESQQTLYESTDNDSRFLQFLEESILRKSSEVRPRLD